MRKWGNTVLSVRHWRGTKPSKITPKSPKGDLKKCSKMKQSSNETWLKTNNKVNPRHNPLRQKSPLGDLGEN